MPEQLPNRSLGQHKGTLSSVSKASAPLPYISWILGGTHHGPSRGPPSPGRVPRPIMELLTPHPPIHSWGTENSTQSTGQVSGLKTWDGPPPTHPPPPRGECGQAFRPTDHVSTQMLSIKVLAPPPRGEA